MKIAIFSPNLSRKNCGGAETYALNLAMVLAEDNDEITIFTCKNFEKGFDMNKIYNKYGSKHFRTEYLLYLPTSKEQIRDIVDLILEPTLRKIAKEYDLFINATQNRLKAPDGIPSIHIIHFPAINLYGVYPRKIAKKFNERYISSYTKFLPNSEFTNYWLERYWNVKGEVLNPIINMNEIAKEDLVKKENIILAVDRLVPDKKIMEMINSFISLFNLGVRDYRFVIAGNSSKKYFEYKQNIERVIKGYPIELRIGIAYDDLVDLYRKSKFFWHAKGYGVDDEDPFNMEHFGMTTVEAMANGCVPIVINKGGQVEIVEQNVQGYRWDSLDELVEYTKQLIMDEELTKKFQRTSIEKSREYTKNKFKERLHIIMNDMRA